MSGLRTAHHVALEDSLHGVSLLGSSEDAASCLATILQRFGLSSGAYLVRSLPASDMKDPLVISCYPVAWVRHYIAQNYIEIDPVVHEAERRVVPVDWSETDRRPASVRRMFGEAAEFGVGQQGLTFCLRGPRQDRALLNIASAVGPREWQTVRHELTLEMQILAQHFHARMMELHAPEASPSLTLTARERQCLTMSAEGYLAKEIARALHVSPPAVRAYLDSARHKLGTVNKTHAVAKALKLGLI